VTTYQAQTPHTRIDSMGSTKPTWHEVADRRRHEIDSRIPGEWLVSKHMLQEAKTTKTVLDLPRVSGILTAWELEVTEMRAVDILAAIRAQKFSSVDVTKAFCKRAAIAHQAVSKTSEDSWILRLCFLVMMA